MRKIRIFTFSQYWLDVISIQTNVSRFAVQVRDCDFGAIVNRDLVKRLRNVNGATAHKTIAQNDLRLAARLCQIFDARANLYQSEELLKQRRKLPFDLPPGAEIVSSILCDIFSHTAFKRAKTAALVSSPIV